MFKNNLKMPSLTSDEWNALILKIRSNDDSLGNSLDLNGSMLLTYSISFEMFAAVFFADRQLYEHDFEEFCEALKVNTTLTFIDLRGECC